MKLQSSILFAMLIASSRAYAPSSTVTTKRAPFYVTVSEPMTKAQTTDEIASTRSAASIQPKQKKNSASSQKKPAAGGHGKEGVFSPLVKTAKNVLGEKELNQVRAKAIGLHSDVIGKFVDTADSDFGNQVLKALFSLADKDRNGTVEEEELSTALKALGFDLKPKQISGIFQRADVDENGALDFEEWRREAPKTLRTNLIKLAKKNGGELGFLV